MDGNGTELTRFRDVNMHLYLHSTPKACTVAVRHKIIIYNAGAFRRCKQTTRARVSHAECARNYYLRASPIRGRDA